MKFLSSLAATAVCIALATSSTQVFAQTTYTGVFRSPTNTATYHQFNRMGGGAAVYINQVATNQPILRLSSGTATANVGVVMTVENDGSVGIGTVSPEAKLAVNGNILAKEIKIKTDITVPDYVFDPGYRLADLMEVEAYVKKYKHLPDIPSAEEIEDEGLDLAEMNLLLLKKVEELTLYVIDLKQDLEALKQQ